jgi:hypothetical protein
MTSIQSMNISLSPPSPSLFSSLSQVNDYDNADYDYVEYDNEPQHGYCDASGMPYLNTLIPTPSLYVNREVEFEEPILSLSSDNRNMMTNLSNPSDRCPSRCLTGGVSWGSAVSAYKAELAEIERVETLSDFTEFNKKSDEAIEKEKRDLKLSTLPKFPKAMRERMEKEAKELANKKGSASNKFYTWKTGASSKNVSRNAWGHRRNGGGRSKTQTLASMNSEKSVAEIAERAIAKRVKQQLETEKVEGDAVRLAQLMLRLNFQKAELQMKEEKVEVEVVVEEETDFQKARREELESFIKMTTPTISYIVEKSSSKPITSVSRKWVDVKKTINETNASKIRDMFYSEPTTKVTRKVVGAKRTGELKTRLCKSVTGNCVTKCLVGSKCLFAHTIDQLNVVVCGFNESCRFVKKVGDSWVNVQGLKLCPFGHSREVDNKESYCKRIGKVITTKPTIKIQKRTESYVAKPTHDWSVAPVIAKPVIVSKPTHDWSVAPVIAKPVIVSKPTHDLSVAPVIAKPVIVSDDIIVSTPTCVECIDTEQPVVKSNYRTRVCKSAMGGGKCGFGGKCNYAHTIKQLVVTKCGFKSCRFVKKVGDYWENVGTKICPFGHSSEVDNKESFCKRIGVVITTKPVINTKKPTNYKVARVSKPTHNWSVAPVVITEPIVL